MFQVFFYHEDPYPPTGQFKDHVQWTGDILKRDASITLLGVQPTFNGTYLCQVRNRPDVHGPSGEIVLRVVEKGLTKIKTLYQQETLGMLWHIDLILGVVISHLTLYLSCLSLCLSVLLSAAAFTHLCHCFWLWLFFSYPLGDCHPGSSGWRCLCCLPDPSWHNCSSEAVQEKAYGQQH